MVQPEYNLATQRLAHITKRFTAIFNVGFVHDTAINQHALGCIIDWPQLALQKQLLHGEFPTHD